MNSHRLSPLTAPARRSARLGAAALALVTAAGLSFSAAAQQRDDRADSDTWWDTQREQSGVARAPYSESRHTYRRDGLWRGEPIHGDDFYEPSTSGARRGYDSELRDDYNYNARTQSDTWGQRQNRQASPDWSTNRYEQSRRQQPGQQQQWQNDWRTPQRFQDSGGQQSFNEWEPTQRTQDQRFQNQRNRQGDPFTSTQFRDSGMTGGDSQNSQRFEPSYGFTPAERTVAGRPMGFQQPTLRYFTQDWTSEGGAFDRWYDGK